MEGDASAGLWGLSVLLPSAEEPLLSKISDDDKLTVLESSLRVMEMFRANQTSVLVTTTASTRGLDFPQVTDVYNLGIVGSAADYLHRAGRVGRIGQSARGAIVSILQPIEVPSLLTLGQTLRFEPKPRELQPAQRFTLEMAEADKEAAIAVLEDVFSLYDAEDFGIE